MNDELVWVPSYEWDFKNGLGEWTLVRATSLPTEAGEEFTATGIVSNIRSKVDDVSGGTNTVVRIKVRRLTPDIKWRGGFLYTTVDKPSFGGAPGVYLPSELHGTEWAILDYDMKLSPPWRESVVTGLWFDIGETGSVMEVESISIGRYAPPVSSITLTPKRLSIGIGHQWQIAAKTFPIDPANPSLTWSSSDPSVTVVNGLVTGVSLGEATITATADNGITASCQVSVVEIKPRSAGETPTGGMRVRRLNKNGDWTFGSGRSNYATGSEAIYQCVLTALLSFRGDWFLDLDHGIPWFNYLRKNPDLMAMENSVKGAVLGVTGVEHITEFDINLNPDTRVATVSVSYIDTFGLENGVTTDVNDNR